MKQVLVALVVGLALAPMPVWASSPEPVVSITPNCGVPGRAVDAVISGQQFTPNSTYIVRFNNELLATGVTDASGAFVHDAPGLVPPAGVSVVEVEYGNGVVSRRFIAPCPSITLSPDCGPAGVAGGYSIEISGSDFQPDAAPDPIQILFDYEGDTETFNDSIATRNFTKSIESLGRPAGTYTVVISHDDWNAGAEFLVPCPTTASATTTTTTTTGPTTTSATSSTTAPDTSAASSTAPPPETTAAPPPPSTPPSSEAPPPTAASGTAVGSPNTLAGGEAVRRERPASVGKIALLIALGLGSLVLLLILANVVRGLAFFRTRRGPRLPDDPGEQDPEPEPLRYVNAVDKGVIDVVAKDRGGQDAVEGLGGQPRRRDRTHWRVTVGEDAVAALFATMRDLGFAFKGGGGRSPSALFGYYRDRDDLKGRYDEVVEVPGHGWTQRSR